MLEYLFTFRSITQAQVAQRVLRQNGISVNLQRSPKQLSKNGCAYALMIAEEHLHSVIQMFRERKIPFSGLYRKTETQTLEEVQP